MTATILTLPGAAPPPSDPFTAGDRVRSTDGRYTGTVAQLQRGVTGRVHKVLVLTPTVNRWFDVTALESLEALP